MYYYCPILKTRTSEINAYEMLDNLIKDEILPIIELTGALGYTYPTNYKVPSLRKTRREGDISTKIKKILDLVQGRKFILDITDDHSLMYDGLSESGGLLDSTNGYQKWIEFLTQDKDFKKLVIPTIQFYTQYRDDVEKQIISLNEYFEYIALKLPIFVEGEQTNAFIFNPHIDRIVNWLCDIISPQKLILILDFDYIESSDFRASFFQEGFQKVKTLQKVKAVIPVSSSFPNFVVKVEKPIKMMENKVSNLLKEAIPSAHTIHGDYASLHPTKYAMGGGGWIPRIDYIIRDDNEKPICYDYVRGKKRNTSSEYIALARDVLKNQKYEPIQNKNITAEGDKRIFNKAHGGEEGKAPSFWIATRSNLFMTAQYIYHKDKGAYLSL